MASAVRAVPGMLLMAFEGAPLVQLSGVVTPALSRKGLCTAGLLPRVCDWCCRVGAWPWPVELCETAGKWHPDLHRSILSAESLPPAPFSESYLGWSSAPTCLLQPRCLPFTGSPFASSAAPASPHLPHRCLQNKSPEPLRSCLRIQHRAGVREGRRKLAAPAKLKACCVSFHVPLRTAGLRSGKLAVVASQPLASCQSSHPMSLHTWAFTVSSCSAATHSSLLSSEVQTHSPPPPAVHSDPSFPRAPPEPSSWHPLPFASRISPVTSMLPIERGQVIVQADTAP